MSDQSLQEKGTTEAAGTADPASAQDVVSDESRRILDVIEAHGDTHDDELDHALARAHSNYSAGPALSHEQLIESQRGRLPVDLYRVERDKLWPTDESDHVTPLAQAAHDQLRGYILSHHFPCIGARAAFSRCTYRYGFYKDLGHSSSAAAMGRDLRRFVSEYEKLGEFTTFVAQFKYPQAVSEAEFEKALFAHLQYLIDFDQAAWDPNYSSDPQSDQFAFSFAGKAFFIVGMHPASSRISRRIAYPTLVFNPESQILRLKEHGHLEKFARSVRERDTRLQGDINPSLPADPNSSGGEANVYSGMLHRPEDPWTNPLVTKGKCPFHK